MILTVTPNTALDVTYRLDSFRLGDTNRVVEVFQRAGGKGVNASRTLHAVGAATTATGFVGGTAGEAVTEELDSAAIEHAFVARQGETRRTVTMICGDDAEPTIVNEPGAALEDGDWTALANRVADLLPSADVVVFAGSLPPGAPRDGYAQLVEIAASKGIATVLDSAGSALAAGLRARPTVIKPNLAELRGLTGIDEPGEAARSVRERFGTSVYVSLGADGALLDTARGCWRAAAPVVTAGNPIGAGDACVAALALGLRAGNPWQQTIQDAVALSAAAVRGPLAGDVDLEFLSTQGKNVDVEVVR